jgi:hypothetical protein
MERLAALVVTGLRVGVAIDCPLCPFAILELYLCVFLLLWVHLLLTLTLAAASFHKIVLRTSLSPGTLTCYGAWSCALGTSCCRRHYWTADGGVCRFSACHGPQPPLQLRQWALRLAAGYRQPSSYCCCCCRDGDHDGRVARGYLFNCL